MDLTLNNLQRLICQPINQPSGARAAQGSILAEVDHKCSQQSHENIYPAILSYCRDVSTLVCHNS